jgi:hypothetical protein
VPCRGCCSHRACNPLWPRPWSISRPCSNCGRTGPTGFSKGMMTRPWIHAGTPMRMRRRCGRGAVSLITGSVLYVIVSSLWVWGSILRKPTQQTRQPKKRDVMVIDASAQTALRLAAQTAVYQSSPYHRVAASKMGALTATRRWPHASKCPPHWDRSSATRALREAIRAGRISAQWNGNFPRFVWHLDQETETLYEARLSNRVLGEYHAYPLEDRREWPINV